MTARAATSALTAHLPTLRRVYSVSGHHPNPALQTTNRFFSQYRDADTGDTGEPFVTYRDYYPDSTKKVTYDDDEPIFLARCRRTISGDACYAALSVEDDGNLSPKYYIYPPFPRSSGDACDDALEVEDDSMLVPPYENYPKPSAYRSCSSSNGLLCFHNMKSEIFLWNPTTNESKILPPSPSIVDPSPGVLYHICSSGIWVDPKSQDCKVMRLIFAHINDVDDFGYPILDSFISQIELYSLKTGCWKRISCPGLGDLRSRRACINGLHGVHYVHALSDLENKSFFSFDFSTETISYIPKPNYLNITRTSYYLLDYNGLPSVLVYGDEKSYKHWVWSDGFWRKKGVFHTCGVDHPISFSRNGRLLFFESLNGRVLAFDCATGKSKHLDVCASAYVLHLIPFSKSSVKLSREDLINLEEEQKEEEPMMA